MRNWEIDLFAVIGFDVVLRDRFDGCLWFSIFALTAGYYCQKGLSFWCTIDRVIMSKRGGGCYKLIISAHVPVLVIFNNPHGYFKSKTTIVKHWSSLDYVY